MKNKHSYYSYGKSQYKKRTLKKLYATLGTILMFYALSIPNVPKQPVEIIENQVLPAAQAQEIEPPPETVINDPCDMKDVYCGEEKSIDGNFPDTANNNLVAKQIYKIATDAGFKWPDYLVRLAYCESHLNPKARNVNKDGTVDRGLFQINNYWHPDITEKQADDVEFATRWTMNMVDKGLQIRWSCDKIVRHQQF